MALRVDFPCQDSVSNMIVHSTKVCLDERLVFLHRRTDPAAPGWKVISISRVVPRKEGHPIFRGVMLHNSLRISDTAAPRRSGRVWPASQPFG